MINSLINWNYFNILLETIIIKKKRKRMAATRDLELLIPVSNISNNGASKSSSNSSSSGNATLSPQHHSGQEVTFIYTRINQISPWNNVFVVIISFYLTKSNLFLHLFQAFSKVIRSWASKKFMTGWYIQSVYLNYNMFFHIIEICMVRDIHIMTWWFKPLESKWLRLHEKNCLGYLVLNIIFWLEIM